MIQNLRDVTVTVLPPQKVCRCGGTKFYRCSAKPDGLQSVCIACARAACRKYYRKHFARRRKLPRYVDGVKQCACGCNSFARSSSTKDGLQSMCRTYMRLAQRRHRKKLREKRLATQITIRLASLDKLANAFSNRP